MRITSVSGGDASQSNGTMWWSGELSDQFARSASTSNGFSDGGGVLALNQFCVVHGGIGAGEIFPLFAGIDAFETAGHFE